VSIIVTVASELKRSFPYWSSGNAVTHIAPAARIDRRGLIAEDRYRDRGNLLWHECSFNLEESTIPNKGLKGHRPPRIQFGALPYRFGKEAGIEVLLVTSRETGRWIIPKGWPIKGFKPAKTAAREAYEEAGVRGHVSGRPLGRYVYEKRIEDRVASFPCEVQVFALLVKTQLKKWPESGQRKVRWFPVPEATAVIGDDDLRKLILQLKEHRLAVWRKHKSARQK
jgi:8-oxo-dGTP pyrophosphatase MutT (NUDIX family)